MEIKLLISQQKYKEFAAKIADGIIAKYRKDVEKYLEEHGTIDTNFVEKLTSKLKRSAINKLGTRAIFNGFFSNRRKLVPRYDGSGLYRNREVEIDIQDIPWDYLNIDSLVPEFTSLVNKMVEKCKQAYITSNDSK